jgi:glycosyltransferase involved in cell wall biosynthesis
MNLNTFQIVIISLLSLSLIAQMAYYWGIFARLAFHKKADEPSQVLPPVSVVVAARNEYHHLKKNLPALLNQEYHKFEVIVVNHASDDETADYLKEMQQNHPNLKVITIERDLNFFHGKKFPLAIGIKSAAHDLLVLTDADCKPASNQWVQKIAEKYDAHTDIVLAYGPYEREKGLLNRVIRYDTFIVAMQYLSYALAGMPYMGVGRNLSYRKNLFFKQKGFIAHYNVSSGDDDLFINQAATAKNTKLALDTQAFVYSEPKHSWNEWFTQKTRHFSSGKKYKHKFKWLLGGYNLSLGIFYLSLLGMLLTKTLLLIALLAFLIRLISQFIIHHKILKRLNEPQLLVFSLFWEPVYILLIAFLGILGLTSKSIQWK